MRFLSLAVLTSAAIVLGACGGGETTPAADAPADAPMAETTPAPEAPATSGAAGITGMTHTVNMVLENNEYKYSPAEITIKQGDGIKFVMLSGGPHNVAFDPALLPAEVKAQLAANMTETMGELVGPLLMAENAEYTISFAGVAPGTYEFFCTPHLALGMKGKVTVEP